MSEQVVDEKSLSKQTCSSSSSSRSTILCVGSINADVLIEIDRLPKVGETIASSDPNSGYMLPGGKGFNQATAVARLDSGLTCSRLATNFGNDSHAHALRAIAIKNGVDVELCQNKNVPSGQAFILLEPGGENSIIIVGGANSDWDTDLSDHLKHAIRNAKCVLLQQEIPLRVNQAVARCAFEGSVPVMMDVGGEERKLPNELLECVSLISPNETELERMTNLPTDTEQQCISAATELLNRGCASVLVTRGSHGAIHVTKNGSSVKTVSIGAFQMDKTKIVDTTGAGDCFRAAYAIACVENQKSIEERLSFAAAACALCIQVKGAQPSMPTRAQVEELLRGHDGS